MTCLQYLYYFFFTEFEIEDKFEIKKNQLIKTYEKWGPQYKIEFNILVKKKANFREQNVFQFTATDNRCCDFGDRIPYFGLHTWEGQTFHFANEVGSHDGKPGNKYINEPYELSKDYKIIIQQYENSENVWIYEIIINGNVIESVENQKPKEYNNVKFYASNRWDTAFTTEYGRVWGMKIKSTGWTEPGKYSKSSRPSLA